MKRALWIVCVAASAPVLGPACSNSTVANVSDYDQSCEDAGDCVAVIDGDICCGCSNAAINKDAKADYDADLGECEAQCDIFCEAAAVTCTDGTCAIAEVEPICEPGTEVFCKCAPDQEGTRICNEDGSDLGECVC